MTLNRILMSQHFCIFHLTSCYEVPAWLKPLKCPHSTTHVGHDLPWFTMTPTSALTLYSSQLESTRSWYFIQGGYLNMFTNPCHIYFDLQVRSVFSILMTLQEIEPNAPYLRYSHIILTKCSISHLLVR